MIKLQLKLLDGLSATDITIFLSKSHPFVVTTGIQGGQTYTVIKDGIHNNGGWEALDAIDVVLDQIDEALKND